MLHPALRTSSATCHSKITTALIDGSDHRHTSCPKPSNRAARSLLILGMPPHLAARGSCPFLLPSNPKCQTLFAPNLHTGIGFARLWPRAIISSTYFAGRRCVWNPHGEGPRQFGSIVPGVFTPVLAKHSKSFSLIDCIAVGVDRMQRNFDPMRRQVEAWQRSELTDVTAKVVIYEAFVEGKLEAPKHLARTVHDLYFEPKYEEFRSRTIWSLSNAFTSAFKELDPIPRFKATAKLGEFLETRFSQSF